MFVRRCELILAAAAAGCVPAESHTLSRVTSGWADQTVAFAEPSVLATLTAGALAAELACVSDADWEAFAGPDLPISPELQAALGSPEAGPAAASGDDSYEIQLSGARILDRDGVPLRLVASPRSDAFTLSLTALEPTGGALFGSALLSVPRSEGDTGEEACDPGDLWVNGSAQWTDAAGREHGLTVPAPGDPGQGLRFACAYVPGGGTIAWSGRMNDEARTFSAADASALGAGDAGCAALAGASELAWPGVVAAGAQGDAWTAEASLALDVP